MASMSLLPCYQRLNNTCHHSEMLIHYQEFKPLLSYLLKFLVLCNCTKQTAPWNIWRFGCLGSKYRPFPVGNISFYFLCTFSGNVSHLHPPILPLSLHITNSPHPPNTHTHTHTHTHTCTIKPQLRSHYE